ncbi:MAG: hypothetical protein ACRC76_12445 [Proteocatella sp.]
MAKKQLQNNIPDISIEMVRCLKFGIKLYPVNIEGKWFIERNYKGKLKRYEKPLTHDEIQKELSQMWLFNYNEIIKYEKNLQS